MNNEQKEKLSQLNGLNDILSEFIQTEKQHKDWKLLDDYHSLFSGNVDSKIMVVQLNPDRTELSWAIRDKRNNCAGKNSSMYLFKKACERSGFHPGKDFFYVNLVPVVRIGEISPELDMIQDFSWVFEGIQEIIKPKIIIPLGRKTLEGLVSKEVEYLTYMDYLLNGVVFDMNSFDLFPMQDPKIVEQEPAMKNKPFFKGLRKLYVRTHNLRQ